MKSVWRGSRLWWHGAYLACALAFWGPATSAAAQAGPRAAATSVVDDAGDEASTDLPWRSSSFTFVQSLSQNSFFKGAQQSYDPTYAWIFIFEPRWYFTKNTYANIDQRMSLELTDSDTTLYRNRAMLTDTVLGVDTRFVSLKLPRLGTFGSSAGVHVVTPTSLASQAATMTFGGRLRAGADVHFDHVLHGATLSFQGRYMHRFLRHSTVEAEESYPCFASGANVQNCAYLGTQTNVRNSLSTIFVGSLELNQYFSVTALAWLTWSRGADLATATFTTDTGMQRELPDTSTTHWRNDRYLLLALGFNATDWLNLGLSVLNYFSERAPDGSLRGVLNPIDTSIGMTVEFALDQIYLAATGHKTSRNSAE